MKLWLFALLLWSIQSFSQVTPAIIDSLNKETQKNLRNPALAKQLADSTYQLAQKLNYLKGQANSAKFKGIGLYISGQPDSAMIYYKEALVKYTSLNDTLEIGKVNFNMANYYNLKADYATSIEFALIALTNFKKVNDLNGAGRVYNLIGQSYYYQKNFKEALQYFHEHLRNARKVNDSLEIASSWSNIGAVFQDLEQYDSAKYYLIKAIDLKERLKALSNIGTSYFNLGTLLAKEKNYDNALINFNKAEVFYKQVADTARLAELYTYQGQLFMQLNKHQDAIVFLQQGINLSHRAGNREIEKRALGMLAEIQAEAGDFKNAYTSLTEFTRISNEILNEKNQSNLNLLRTQFETEKKELQVAEQQLKLKQNKWLIIFQSIILVLVVVIVIIWRKQSESKKQKELAQREKIFQQQLTESVIASQEKERARFAKDLHDGLGQLISTVRLFVNQSTDQWKNSAFDLLDQMHLEIRNIAFALLPNTLVSEGLISALRELASRLNQSGTMKIQITSIGMDSRLSDTLEVSLYRVCQEWINNILKYGKADSIIVQVVRHDKTLSLLIEDNGEGFDTTLLDESKGYGWRNIRSRIQLHQGTLFIESGSGRKGSSLIVELPLPIISTMKVA